MPDKSDHQLLHLILSWSRVLSWILLVFDLAAIAFLTTRAYQDGMCIESRQTRLRQQRTRSIASRCPFSATWLVLLLMQNDLLQCTTLRSCSSISHLTSVIEIKSRDIDAGIGVVLVVGLQNGRRS